MGSKSKTCLFESVSRPHGLLLVLDRRRQRRSHEAGCEALFAACWRIGSQHRAARSSLALQIRWLLDAFRMMFEHFSF